MESFQFLYAINKCIKYLQFFPYKIYITFKTLQILRHYSVLENKFYQVRCDINADFATSSVILGESLISCRKSL